MSWKKDEDSDELGALLNLDHSAVLQEARIFNQTPIRPRQSRLLLAKIVFLLYRGDSIPTIDATNLFFSITKLFQCKDMSLRQMVYLTIKELSTVSEDVIMVTSSLMKDMQPKSEITYRANAIRALCKIVDPSMLPGIERLLKAAIVEKLPSIASAALVSSIHLFTDAKDVVRRWGNEASEALNGKALSMGPSFFSGSANQNQVVSTSNIVQYHAIGLLYAIRQHDRMAVLKLVQTFSGQNKSGGWMSGPSPTLRSNMAHVMLIRYAVRVMENDPSLLPQLCTLLQEWMSHSSDMVSLEAARAVCQLKDVDSRPLTQAVGVLQMFLGSPRATARFAAIRTLNTLARTHPEAVQPCNVDMENLITDKNRSVATFAITTLLKTGNEASVDRLMKQMQGFMAEISDEFKIIVAEAVRSLCRKFPGKHSLFLSFLSGVLRDEGGYEFKRSAIEAIIDLAKNVPECKETALAHLCEFIEDCEFTKLSVRVLYFLGEEGPLTAKPTIYIRHIYNRVVLENAVVRAAAVNALAKFGASSAADPSLQRSVRVLLKRCLDDRDDEVRDRSAWALRMMDNEKTKDKYVRDDSTFALAVLERKLVEYCADPAASLKGKFSFESVPRISRAQEEESRNQARLENMDAVLTGTTISAPSSTRPIGAGISEAIETPGTPMSPGVSGSGFMDEFEQQARYASQLNAIPEIAAFGDQPLVSSRKPVDLTEAETEYVVRCIKHVYDGHIVFQFDVTNTIPEQVLEQIEVAMEPEEDIDGVLEPVVVVPIPELKCNQPGTAYVAFARADTETFPSVSFACTLKFIVKECDPATGEPEEGDDGFEDEYSLEATDLGAGDFMQSTYIPDSHSLWEVLGQDAEAIETFALANFDGIEECITKVNDLLGMSPLDGALKPKSKAAHQAVFTGKWMGRVKTVARTRMTYQKGAGVTMELAVRSEDQGVSELMVAAIA
ncbi:coatomer subunit gamma [Coemansia spiralis]|uniref:Coatomer subunit gamma n=2 Tax=Coemansia TaxID=4863 RepID=A0A9W8L1G1_9FUNG|nr:adaptin N terminal region-domain-containing protein [Coemansia spiralis]KAJ1992461.1 coatomer subunit gamma [Coemansia umbellata]KAJ2621790.1 coatomer subunit gamma [Coemansia sp. RSA 1358]KAJ2681177.1 coatomer subunit gamma [Coemansia spiralis]